MDVRNERNDIYDYHQDGHVYQLIASRFFSLAYMMYEYLR
jgi:hypothetical protein